MSPGRWASRSPGPLSEQRERSAALENLGPARRWNRRCGALPGWAGRNAAPASCEGLGRRRGDRGITSGCRQKPSPPAPFPRSRARERGAGPAPDSGTVQPVSALTPNRHPRPSRRRTRCRDDEVDDVGRGEALPTVGAPAVGHRRRAAGTATAGSGEVVPWLRPAPCRGELLGRIARGSAAPLRADGAGSRRAVAGIREDGASKVVDGGAVAGRGRAAAMAPRRGRQLPEPGGITPATLIWGCTTTSRRGRIAPCDRMFELSAGQTHQPWPRPGACRSVGEIDPCPSKTGSASAAPASTT